MKAQYDLFHHNSAMRKQDPNCELFYVKAKPQFITTFKMAQMQWKIENYVLAPNCIKYSTCVCLCPAEWDFCQTMHFERENAFLTRSWGSWGGGGEGGGMLQKVQDVESGYIEQQDPGPSSAQNVFRGKTTSIHL